MIVFTKEQRGQAEVYRKIIRGLENVSFLNSATL